MDIFEWAKKNIAVLLTGLVGLIAGAMFFGADNAGIEQLEKKLGGKLQTIESKIQSLSTDTAKFGDLEEKITELDKASEPLPKTVDTLATEMQKLEKGVAAIQAATIEQQTNADKRFKKLEAKLAQLVEKHEKMAMPNAVMHSKTPQPKTSSTAAPAAKIDGIRLSIGQSAWLIKNKLNATLAYVYPDQKHARVGVNGTLYELSKGTVENFEFEGKRCGLTLNDIQGRQAIIKHKCQS